MERVGAGDLQGEADGHQQTGNAGGGAGRMHAVVVVRNQLTREGLTNIKTKPLLSRFKPPATENKQLDRLDVY